MTLVTMTTRQRQRAAVTLHIIWCCWIYLLVVTVDTAEQRMHDGQLHALTDITFSCQGRPSGYYPDPKYPCQVYHVCDGRMKRQSFTCSSLEITNKHSAISCNRNCATRTHRSTGSVGAPVTSSSASGRSAAPGSRIPLENVPDYSSSRIRGSSHLRDHRLLRAASRNPSRRPRIFSALDPKMHELSNLQVSHSSVSVDRRENRDIIDEPRCTAAQVNSPQQKDVRCRHQTEELKVALPFPPVSSAGARIGADARDSIPGNTFRSLGTRGSFSFGTGVNTNRPRVNDDGIVMLLQISSVAASTRKLFQNRGRFIPESHGARHRVTSRPLVEMPIGRFENTKTATAAVSSSGAIRNMTSSLSHAESRKRQRTFSTTASANEAQITRPTNNTLASAGLVDIFDISLFIQPPKFNVRPDLEKSKKSAASILSELQTNGKGESVETGGTSNPVYFSALALIQPKVANSATFSGTSSVLVPTISGSLLPPLPSAVRESSTSTGTPGDVREDRRSIVKFAAVKHSGIRTRNAECFPCVRSFIRDLENCSPCVMIR